MTDQKGSANNAPDSEAGRQAGNTDNPTRGDLAADSARPAEGEGRRSPSSRGGRKSAAPKAAASKTATAKATGSSEEKSRKTSGGRSPAKKAAARDTAPQADGADAAPAAASKRDSRGGTAKTGAKTPSKRSAAAAKETNQADGALKATPENTETAADKARASASSGRAGKTGGAGRTGGAARQGKSARGGKNAAVSGHSAPAQEVLSGDAPTPAEPAVDAPVAGRDESFAAKPASGRTRGSRGGRGRAKASSAPAQSLPVSDGAPVEAAAAGLSDVTEDAPVAADAAGLEAGAGHAPFAEGFAEAEEPEAGTVAQGEAAPAEDAESAAFAPMDFPLTFGDASPEDFFDVQAEASSEGAGTEKKRRGRSRRNRGRRKSSALAAAAQAAGAAEGADDDAVVSAVSVEDELFDDVSESISHDDEDLDGDDASEARPSGRRGEHKGGRGRAGDEEQDAAPAKVARRKMFVCVLPGEQVEVVITEEGQVQEYYVEMLHQAKTKGNIYKAVIHNVDPNLQAAFVSYGAVKNGFLQIDEIHPEYYVTAHDESKGRKYPPIQKVIKPGQEVLVQVVKEPAGTKGAFLTTYLSMPGRFLVLTPGREQIGVSRKVENEGERARLRELLEGLSPGPGLGVIVRTVSMGASKTSLHRDLQYLKRTWKDVRARGTTEKAPCLIYQEEDLTTRAVRDYLTEAVGEVWIDDEATAASIAELAETLFPKKPSLVRAHKDPAISLFERFNLQRQLDQIQSREVSLPSGGRLVIDPTEALTAIDINSGRSGGKSNFEDMAYRTNMEAAKMIPLQLRLRDIGGQVVADFIEMRDKSHWREVEKTLRNGMKVDRARYDVGKIGPFGMLEIVRQRLGSSAISISTEPCPCCNGTGVRRNMEWQSQHALRDIHRALRNAQAQNQTEIVYQAEQPLALHLLNNKRQRLLEMEQSFGIHIDIRIKFPEAL